MYRRRAKRTRWDFSGSRDRGYSLQLTANLPPEVSGWHDLLVLTDYLVRAMCSCDVGRRPCCERGKYMLTAQRRIAWSGRGGTKGGCKQLWDVIQYFMTWASFRFFRRYVTTYSAGEGGLQIRRRRLKAPARAAYNAGEGGPYRHQSRTTGTPAPDDLTPGSFRSEAGKWAI